MLDTSTQRNEFFIGLKSFDSSVLQALGTMLCGVTNEFLNNASLRHWFEIWTL